MESATLTGAAAVSYLAAWMESARPGRRGLDARRLAADARAGTGRALARLRQATIRAACPSHARVTRPGRRPAHRRRSSSPVARPPIPKAASPPRTAGAS